MSIYSLSALRVNFISFMGLFRRIFNIHVFNALLSPVRILVLITVVGINILKYYSRVAVNILMP